MGRISIRALSMMLLMMTAGCLQAVDGVIEDIDRTIDALEGDYPKLDLPERTRSSPSLQNYDACETLLEDLQSAVYDEMIVNLDQQSYWHWVSEPIMLRMDGDAFFAEPELSLIHI